jgi:cysteine desulfurase
MQTLTEFLTSLRGDGLLSLLAGHYTWPGRPDAFGIDSSVHMADALEQLDRDAVNAHIFVDDIAASALCSVAHSNKSTAVQQKWNVLEGNGCGLWISKLLPTIEKAVISQNNSWLDQADQLVEFLETLNPEETLPSEILRLRFPREYDGLASWLADVELLVYHTAKSSFRPLLLAHETRKKLPQVLFERTMTNGASRMLHKIRNGRFDTNLQTSIEDDSRVVYWVQNQNHDRIELRDEIMQAGGLRANNKCSAILSHLFFYACKTLTKKIASRKSLSVFYIIPSYDRERLRDGVKAFFELYGNVDAWFGVSEVNLAFAFYTLPDRSELCCEVHSGGGQKAINVATHRISTPASRRFRTTLGLDPGSNGRERIYVDHNATTPLDSRVLQKMMPFLTGAFGNAASAHSFGWEAELAIAEARQQIAELIGAETDEIFFTSGTTESNNWFLKQLVQWESVRLISSAIEHKAILEPLDHLRQNKIDVTYVPFDNSGEIDLEAVRSASQQPNTVITLMAVNNEIHSILDLNSVGALSNEVGAIFHTDAAQALGRVPLNVKQMGIHAMSMSAHKIYGPKGIGALFVTRVLQKKLLPLLLGGGQERGLRSGTYATSLIVGFGEACAIAKVQMSSEAERLFALADFFISRLHSHGVTFRLIGPRSVRQRQPGSLLLTVDGLEANKLSELLPEIALSRGSACSSLAGRSHVLKAMNIKPEAERSSFRLSFGRNNVSSHALYVADRIADVLALPKLTADRVMIRV